MRAEPTSKAAPSEVLARAQRTPLHRTGVRELMQAFDAAARTEGLSEALARSDERSALSLAFSLAAERALPTTLLAELLPDVEDPQHVVYLVGGGVGDRLDMLGKLLDAEVLVEDAEAMLLWLSTERLGLVSPISPEWLIRLRRIARRRVEQPDAEAFLGGALSRFTEAPVVTLSKSLVDAAATPKVAAVLKKQAAEVLARFEAPLEAVLGDEEAPRLLATVTVKSSEPKLGRNDPCPCGSGKKYKKCHGAGEDAGGKPANKTANAGIDAASLTAKDLPYLRMIELAALDLTRMKKDTLSAALSRALLFRRWALAERCAEVLTRVHADALAFHDVALGAIDGGRWDVVDRLLERWSEDELPVDLRTHRALRDAGPALAPVERITEEMLLDPKSPLFELALGLLHRAPALGIAVGRGLVAELPAEDGDALVIEIERARDVLGLPPGDAAHDLVRTLDEDDERRAELAAAESEIVAERDKLRASLARRDEELSARGAEVTSLAMRLEEMEDELLRLAERAEAKPGKGARAPDERAPDEERKKLAARIEELKGLVQEGNRERAALRRQITELSEELDLRTERPTSRARRAEEPEQAELEVDLKASPRVPVVPIFSRAARDSLAGFPVRIRKQAIEQSASLASGDPAAWRNVKQMEGVAKVWSARLGIHNRLLFRVHDDHLEVLDVVTREDLLKVLERWR